MSRHRWPVEVRCAKPCRAVAGHLELLVEGQLVREGIDVYEVGGPVDPADISSWRFVKETRPRVVDRTRAYGHHALRDDTGAEIRDTPGIHSFESYVVMLHRGATLETFCRRGDHTVTIEVEDLAAAVKIWCDDPARRPRTVRATRIDGHPPASAPDTP